MARDPLDDLLDDIAPAEGDSVAVDEYGEEAPPPDPLDDLLGDLAKRSSAPAAPATPTRADLPWTTSLYDLPLQAGGTVKPPPMFKPHNDLQAGLQQMNQALDMGPKLPPGRDAMLAPPPTPGPPLAPSAGRLSRQKFGKLSGNELPEQSRAMKILEPAMRPLVGFGAGTLQTAQNVVQLMGAGWGKKPIFNSKTFIRDLETAGVYGEAGFWARNSEKAGDLGSQLAFMGGISGALIKGGVPEFIAQQAGMGAVAATAAAAEAQNSGEKLTGDQWASLTIENLVTYPLFAHGVGSLAKTALAGSKYAKALTPAVSAAATGAAFEGLPEPAPGESRLENMLVGAFTFGMDAALRHNFPGMTRSFRERGAKKQTGFAQEALEATADGKRTPAEDAALELKNAHSRAEEFVLNFIAQSRLAGLDPYQKGASHALSPEMVATAARIDPITAQQIIARHRAVKNDVTKEITTNMVKERVVELARQAGGEKQAQEARYRLGMMDPFEARRYQTSDRGEGSEIGYQKANQKQTSALMKEARESLKAEFLDQFRAQATGALEESQLLAGNEAEQARVARFADESRQDAIIRTAREDQARAEQLRKEVAVEDARARGIQPPPVGPTVAPPPSPVGAEPPVTTRARMLERATARGEAEPGMKRFRLDEATDADVAAMEGELAPPPAEPPSPAEQLRTQIQAREFGPKFGGAKPPPVAGRQEPPPPGARAATKYRKTGAPTNLPTGERAPESRLVPTRPKRLPKKKAQRALNETVRRLAPTEVAGPLREIPQPPPTPPAAGTPLRAEPKRTERTEFGKVRAAFKGRGESPPPVKAAAPPEPPKVAPVAEQPKPEAPPVEKKPGKAPKPEPQTAAEELHAAYEEFATARATAETLRRNALKASKRAGVPGTESFAYAEEADIRHRKAVDDLRDAQKRYQDLQSFKKPEAPAETPKPPPIAKQESAEMAPAKPEAPKPPPVESPRVVETPKAPDTPAEAAAKVEDQVERVVDTRGARGGEEIRNRIVATLEGELRDVLRSDGEHKAQATVKQDGMSHGFLDGEHVLSVSRYGFLSNEVRTRVGPGQMDFGTKIEGFRDMNPHQKELAVLRAVWGLNGTPVYKDGKAKIRMRIPGDGTFTLLRTPRQIEGMLDRLGGTAGEMWRDVAKKFESQGSPNKPKFEPETPEPETAAEVSQRVEYENSKRYENAGKGWKKGAETISKKPEKEGGKPIKEDVTGFVDPTGTFIIHNPVDGPKTKWTVTHIASGLSVGHEFAKAEAQVVAARMLDIAGADWGFKSLAQFEKDVKDVVSGEGKQIIAAVREGEPFRATDRQIAEGGAPQIVEGAATKPADEVSADIEKNSMPREKRAVTRAKVILGDKADKSPEAGPASAKDKRIADKLADAVERHNQREEVEEKARNRRKRNGRKGDSGKYIAYGLAGAVAGTILASDDDEAKKVALAGLPFVFFPKGRKPSVGRLPAAERASAEAWARTPLDRGPLRPGPMDTPEGARLAMNGQPGPRRIEQIIDQIFPEIGVGEDRIFRPVEQPTERKVQYQKSDLEPDLGREHLFQGSDAPGVTAPHQPNLITRKLQSASHALTGFGAPGEALNRGVNFVEQAVNTRAGRLLFEYKRTIVEAQERAGIKDDFTRTMNAKETKHFEAFWEHVVSGKPMPKDVQENANTKVRVIADWASRMIDGRRVAGLTKEEAIVSDALTKFWSDQLASTAVEATDTIKHWVEMPMYGLPVVIAPEALTPEPRKIGRLGVRAWQEKSERAQALQEKIIDEAIEARPGMTRAQVRDHLSKMSGMAEDPLFNISIGEPEASHANFLDRHRLLDVKSGRVLDPVKLFDLYFPNIIRRVEMARMWGGDMELARDIMDVAKGDRQNTDAMATLFDIASNQAPKTTSQALNNLSALVSVKSLGRAGIRQLSTWANEMKYPVRYRDGFRAMNDSFRYAVSESHLPKEFRKKFYNEEHDLFVHEMGTAMRNEYSHVLSSLSGIIGKGTHMLLKYPYLVTPLDRLPRLKASMWARRSIHALIPEIEHAIRTGNTERFGNKKYYQDVARELWQDPAVQKIALKPTHTAAEIEALKINAAEWLVARTNGRSEPRDMPAVMQHPIGKEMFKFQQFNLRATAEFHREWNFTDPKSTIRNKAAQMKLFAGTAASLGLGYGIYRALAALRKDDKSKDDPLSHQIIETMAGAGMYSSLIAAFDIFSGSYGRDAGEKILGATLGTAADAGQAAFRTGATGKSDAARSFMIQNMPEPFWGPWFGIPARSDLRQDEKERRKVEKRRESSGY